MHLANQLLGGTISIEEIGEDTNLLINAINEGKHGIVHPQLLTPKQLIEELKKLEEEQSFKYPVRLVEYNYQHIIDISDLSVTIIDKRLTYCLQVPILEPETLRCLHLIPIPKPHGKTFVAAVPTHEIILVNQENSFYVPSDRDLIRDCKHLDNIRMCKRTQPSYLVSEIHSCESELFKSSVKTLDSQVCQISIFQIQELVYIPLYGDNQYILIPEETTEINTICDDRTETITLSSIKKNVFYKKNVSLPFEAAELELLNDNLPTIRESLTPVKISEFRTTLDNIEATIRTIRNDRRTHSWRETTSDILRYMGYISIGIITAYVTYKIGVFKCISKLIPTNLCINLFCVKTTVNATPQVHVTPTADPIVQAEYVAIPETEIVRPRTLRLKIIL